MADHLSSRVQQIKPSATLAVSAKANELRSQGIDVINLSVGEPDFVTPEHICQAGVRAIKDGHTHYLPVDGIAALKKAIVDKFKRDNALEYQPNQILVSNGAKQSLYNIMQACIEPGDEVIVPTPYWVSYPAMVMLAGGTPIIVETTADSQHKLTAKQLEAAITPNTRFVMLNSPSNPSGMCYSIDELKALGEVLLRYPQILVASDDIYEHLTWKSGGFCNIANACPELFDRCIIVNGVSKAYAMTGWRIGYLAGPASLVAAMKKVQSHATSGACSIAQYAAIEALNGPQNCLAQMLGHYKKRHDLVFAALSKLPGFVTHPSDGTFYLFPEVSAAYTAIGVDNDVAFCEKLLEEAHIAAVPGSAFGVKGHIRLSFATDEATLNDAMQRLAKLFNQ